MRRTTPMMIMTSLVLAATAAPAHAAAPGEATADLAPAAVAAVSESYTGYLKDGEGIGSGQTSGVFRVPDLTCGAEDEGFVLTTYAFDAEDYFLAGSDLFVSCQSGSPVYDGHVTTSGGQIPVWQEMEPGDKIRLSINKRAEGPSTHDVVFESLTRGWSSSLPTNSAVDRIEVGFRRMSIGGVRIPPPAYKTKVKSVQFDGVGLGRADATKVRLVDDTGERLNVVRDPQKKSYVIKFL